MEYTSTYYPKLTETSFELDKLDNNLTWRPAI